MSELELSLNALPTAAKRELRNFYEYLVFKYLKDMKPQNHTPADADIETDRNLAAFRRFKKRRDHMNPVVDKSVDIDALINEANRDIS